MRKYIYIVTILLIANMVRASTIWQEDSDWIPLYTLSDAASDIGNNGHSYLDIVGDATYASGFLQFYNSDSTASEDLLLLRLRLNGKKNKMKGSWQFFFETDGDDEVEWVLQLSSDDLTSEGTIQMGTSSGESESDITFGSVAWTGSYEDNVHWTGEATGDGSQFGGDDDYFLDLSIPWNSFSSLTGIDTNAPSFRVAIASSQQSGQLSDGGAAEISTSDPITSFEDFGDYSGVIPEPAVATLLVGTGAGLLISRRVFFR